MIDIGSKLKKARKERNLTLRELAAMTDVSASLLSQIENNRSNPSVNTLYVIAEALEFPVGYFFLPEDVPQKVSSTDKTPSEMRLLQEEMNGMIIDHFYSDEEQEDLNPIVTPDTRSSIGLKGGITWSRLTQNPEMFAEFLEITYEPGASSGAKHSHHSGREFGYILEGTLLLELGFESYMMKPGDSIIFDSATPHRLTNPSDTLVRALWVLLTNE